jgi:hypothetical protein
MLAEMTSDQLAEFHLRWLPASVIFDQCTDATLILVYDGQYPLDQVYLADLETALEDGSRDEVTLLLHEYVDQLEAEGAQVMRWRRAHPIKAGGHRVGYHLHNLGRWLLMLGADDPEWGADRGQGYTEGEGS